MGWVWDMEQQAWQNDIKSSFERLSAKSAAAQSQIFKDTLSFIKQAGEKKIDMTSVTKTGTSLLTEAIAAYTQLHIDYASKIIDLGLSFTHGMLSSLGPGETETAAPQKGAQSSAFALQLSGLPGDCCQTAFILESTNKKPVRASYKYTAFHTADKSAMMTIPLKFDPAECTINPGEKFRIVLEAPLPLDAKAGQYEAQAWISDVPEMNFKIVVTVMASGGADAETRPRSVASRPRKKTARGAKKPKK
jgi:hypothetical protein